MLNGYFQSDIDIQDNIYDRRVSAIHTGGNVRGQYIGLADRTSIRRHYLDRIHSTQENNQSVLALNRSMHAQLNHWLAQYINGAIITAGLTSEAHQWSYDCKKTITFLPLHKSQRSRSERGRKIILRTRSVTKRYWWRLSQERRRNTSWHDLQWAHKFVLNSLSKFLITFKKRIVCFRRTELWCTQLSLLSASRNWLYGCKDHCDIG